MIRLPQKPSGNQSPKYQSIPECATEDKRICRDLIYASDLYRLIYCCQHPFQQNEKILNCLSSQQYVLRYSAKYSSCSPYHCQEVRWVVLRHPSRYKDTKIKSRKETCSTWCSPKRIALLPAIILPVGVASAWGYPKVRHYQIQKIREAVPDDCQTLQVKMDQHAQMGQRVTVTGQYWESTQVKLPLVGFR